MADIRIHREHQLGLQRAREIAESWAEQVEAKYGMDCTIYEGEDTDSVEFSRSGVKGELTVAADHFELQAKLGFLVGAFRKTIEGEIQKELDSLLAAQAPPIKPSARPATKPAAGKKKPA